VEAHSFVRRWAFFISRLSDGFSLIIAVLLLSRSGNIKRLIGNQLKHKEGVMTQTSGISQAGMQPQLINQGINEVKQQSQFKPEVEKEDSGKNVDTVNISVNITNKPAIEFDPINEEEAINLAQLAAKDITNQAFGMSTQGTTDALRNII